MMELIKEMLGKTMVSVNRDGDESLTFIDSEATQYRFEHDQDCCEDVSIEDVCGNLDDLVGSPLIMAEVVTSDENPEGVNLESQDSFTWTFYKFATIKGYVTVRWYGESNGYYSESVDLHITPAPGDGGEHERESMVV